MARKKQKQAAPKQDAPFRHTPFAALKGVVVEPSQTHASNPQPPPAAPPKRESSQDELFLQAMAGVRQLDTGGRTDAAKVRPPGKGAPSEPPKMVAGAPAAKLLPRDEVVARRTFLQEVERLQLDVRFEDRLQEEDELRPLSGNRLRQLKRGIVQLDRQLDLHGLTREEALEALPPFLQAAQLADEKAVLVITGKGMHSTEGPVLQQVVAAWLRDQGRAVVSEFAPAPRELGGSGAYVVFVRPLDKAVKE